MVYLVPRFSCLCFLFSHFVLGFLLVILLLKMAPSIELKGCLVSSAQEGCHVPDGEKYMR